MFKKEFGDWVRYRELPQVLEIDFHTPESPSDDDHMPYHARMDDVWQCAVNAIERAFNEGYQYVLFTHGWSTSGIGQTTSRSQVRKLMKDKAATPFIIRKNSIQHESVFVAAIRPKQAV